MFDIPYNEREHQSEPPRQTRTRPDWDERRSKTFRKKMFSDRLIQDLEAIDRPGSFLAPDIWSGEGLFLYGKAGYGKTLYTAFLTEEIAAHLWMNYQSKVINFVSAPELFINLKKSYSDPNTHDWQIMDKCTTPWLLVLDDFGVGGKPSEWVLENLYYLINQRYENLLPTLITSNLPLAELAEMYGDVRITSRIQRMCMVYQKSNWKAPARTR